MQAERAVTDMTNELLKKNADALKMGTIETAKESQRGVVDIETLQQTNKSLIETLGNGWAYCYTDDKIKGFKQTHQPLSLIHIFPKKSKICASV